MPMPMTLGIDCRKLGRLPMKTGDKDSKMAGFKIVNGVKITTNNTDIATRLKTTFEASNDRLNSAIETLFASPKEPQPDQGSTFGMNGNGSFDERPQKSKGGESVKKN